MRPQVTKPEPEPSSAAARRIGIGDCAISGRAKELVLQVLNSNRLSAGPVMAQFEHEVAALHGCAYGLMLNSGTSALQVALAALKERHGWQDGDEVLVPAVTFVATSNVVALQRPHAGLLRRRARLLLHRPDADRGADHGSHAGDHAGAHRRSPLRHGPDPRGRGEARAADGRGLGRVVRRALQRSPRRLLRRCRLLLDVRRARDLDGRRRRLHDRRPRAADADEEPHEPRPRRGVHAHRRRHGRGEGGRAGDSGAPLLVYPARTQLPRDGDGGCARHRPAGGAAGALRPADGDRATADGRPLPVRGPAPAAARAARVGARVHVLPARRARRVAPAERPRRPPRTTRDRDTPPPPAHQPARLPRPLRRPRRSVCPVAARLNEDAFYIGCQPELTDDDVDYVIACFESYLR